MYTTKYYVNNAAAMILEYQKNIILNKQCIIELEKDGLDADELKKEIAELELKIKNLKKATEFVS